jgi:acetyltransferase-like isoleucine patch superfamily enzyme
MIKKLKSFISKKFTVKLKNKGNNNLINIDKSVYLRKVKINIYGDNNKIEISKNAYLHNVVFRIGFPDCPVNNCTIKIGESTSFNSAEIQFGEDNSEILIGDNCMFSFNIEITCSDTHSILDENGNIINVGKSIIIGNNVWICKNATIMKNSKIPDNCVVAQNCVITKEFDKQNSVLAGIPARIVKENISWTRERPNNFIKRRKNNA